jgi:hypothetical protein
MTARLIMSGYGLETTFSEHGASGESRSVEVDTYDSATKSYPYLSIASDGGVYQGSFTIVGNVATFEGIIVVNGRHVRTRGTDAVAPDGMSITMRGEISADGRTWVPQFISKRTKVKAAPAGRTGVIKE